MKRKGYERIEDFRCVSLQHIVGDLKYLSGKAKANVDGSKCIGRNICVVACQDTAYDAMSLIAGCGLCRQVCPVNGCFKLIRA